MKKTPVVFVALSLAACAPSVTPPESPAESAKGASVSEDPHGGQSAKQTHSKDRDATNRDAVNIEVGGALLAPLPVAVTSFGAATVGGAVYMLGGYHGIPHQYEKQGQSKSLMRLDLSAGAQWKEVSTINGGLQGLALVAHGNEVCRFGGNRIQNDRGEKARMLSVKEAACYDTKTGKWRDLPDMPAGRSSHEAAVVGSTVYVAGGWAMGKDGKGAGAKTAVWLENIVSLDLSDPKAEWKTTPAPFKRRALEVVSAGGKVYVIGGFNPKRAVSKRVDVFDPATGEWSDGPRFPSGTFGIAGTTMDGTIYACARDGIVYGLEKDGWVARSSLTFPRFFHRLAPAGDGTLVAVGGITGMQPIGRTRHTERVILSKGKPIVQYWSMDHPGKAKNRQAVFVANDALYLFGGNNSLGQHDFAVDNFLAEGWRLHLPSMRYKSVAAFPHHRQSMQTLVSGEPRKLVGLAVGGFGHPKDGGKKSKAISHPNSYAFDFAKETWSERGGLPRGRTQFGLTHHSDALWIFGGLNYDPVARKGMKAFAHETSLLTTLAADTKPFDVAKVPLPGPRRAFAGATHGDHYYLVGGMKQGFQLVKDCLRFSFVSKTFESIACPSNPRLSGELLSIGERLYLVGGSFRPEPKSKMKVNRSIEMYDPKSNTWSVLVDDVGFNTKHMRASAYRGRILLTTTHMKEPRIRVTIINPNL